MKNLKSYENFIFESNLNEIGDSSLPAYDWKLDKSNPSLELANFNANGIEYEVFLSSFNNGVNVTFTANGSDKITTNQGNQFRIMPTIIEIIKDYLKRRTTVNQISFVPNEDFKNDTRRLKLYMAYIEKQFDVKHIKINQLQNNKVVDIEINR